MAGVAERAWFDFCRALGRLLRSARYSKVGIVQRASGPHVQKHRVFYAPILVGLGGPLVRLLNTGMRVLGQREWQERECHVYRSIYGTAVRMEDDATLALPYLPGETLATLLDDAELDESVRRQAMERAVTALAQLHRHGFTHGDAMAENVMVDRHAGVARWFDFETMHDERRPIVWRRADDVRALLATCFVRTSPRSRGETLHLILDVYADDAVTRQLASSFASVWRRSLPFHLGQAGLSLKDFHEIARALRERLREATSSAQRS